MRQGLSIIEGGRFVEAGRIGTGVDAEECRIVLRRPNVVEPVEIDAWRALLTRIRWPEPIYADPDYLLTAADQAGRGWAYHEAINLCNQALQLVPEGEEMLRRRVRLRRAVALQEREHAEIDVGIGIQSKSSGEMSPPVTSGIDTLPTACRTLGVVADSGNGAAKTCPPAKPFVTMSSCPVRGCTSSASASCAPRSTARPARPGRPPP
jgi:hypothetical protein